MSGYRYLRVSDWMCRLAALLCAGLGLSAGIGSAARAEDHPISIYFVGCSAPTGFHGYLARGAEEAGKNLGLKVTYIYPDQLTIPNQIQKIEEAIAAKADGIAVCVFAEDSVYTEVAARAKAAGIALAAPQRRHPARACATRTIFSSSGPVQMNVPLDVLRR